MAVEIGIRLIERLVANGVRSGEDAIGVYKNSLAGLSDPAGNAAVLRVLEAIKRDAELQ